MLRLSIPSSNSLTMLANAAKRNQAACTSEASSNAHIWNPQAAQHSVSSTSPGACVRCYAANRVIVCRESVCISLGPYVWGNKRNSLLVLPSFPRWMFSSGHCFLMNSIVENNFFRVFSITFYHVCICLPQCLSLVITHGHQLLWESPQLPHASERQDFFRMCACCNNTGMKIQRHQRTNGGVLGCTYAYM